jgi:hypothetical protein
VLTSKERAIEVGITRLAGDTDDENLRLPAVRDRLNQSRRAAIGVIDCEEDRTLRAMLVGMLRQ